MKNRLYINDCSESIKMAINSLSQYIYPIHEQPFTFTVTENIYFVQVGSRRQEDIIARSYKYHPRKPD